MTQPGDATGVGSIVGYLILNRDDWLAGVAGTKRDADDLGRLSPKITIQVNSADTIAKLGLVSAAEKNVGQSAKEATPFTVNLWAALSALAPAAVPIAGVLTGALAGLIPTLATLALGVKGISTDMQSASFAITPFGRDLTTLKNQLTELEQTSANGLLAGVAKAMPGEDALFRTLNTDIGQTSVQLGNIIAGAAPALLKILQDLNPLFITFGQTLVNGAQHLEAWASSSDGVKKFGVYVQDELPAVEQLIGNLIVLFSHLVEGAAPFGGVMLTDINLFTRALAALPVSTLQIIIPLAVALYGAVKAYQGLNAVVNGVSTAIAAMKTPFVGTAAQAKASQLSISATAAQEAADVKAGKLAELQAIASTAQAQADAAVQAATWGAVYDEQAQVIAQAAADEVTSFEAVALAAQASADRIAGAAATAGAAAETEAAAGTTAGFSAMIGPIGAVAIGVGLLTSLFVSNSAQQKLNTQAADAYTQSLQQNSDALAAVNINATLKNLQDDGAYKLTDQLNASNKDLGLTYGQLALAVNGSQTQFNGLIGVLQEVAAANKTNIQGANQGYGRGPIPEYNAQGVAANNLIATLTKLRATLTDEEKAELALAEAQKQAQIAIDGGTTAVANQARQYGVSTDAYLAAQQAAQQNTEQQQAQTLAYQLENNAVGLLNDALNSLAGQNLNVAQAQTALDGAIQTLNGSLKTNGKTVDDNTAKGVANQQAIEGVASALRAKLVADTQGKTATEAQTKAYQTQAAQILDNIAKMDGDKTATDRAKDSVYTYTQNLLKIPPVKKTTIDLNTDEAQKELQTYLTALAGAGATFHGQLVGIGSVDRFLPAAPTTSANAANAPQATPSFQGSASGHAYGTSSSVAGWFWVGEQGPEMMRLPAGTAVKSGSASISAQREAASKFSQGSLRDALDGVGFVLDAGSLGQLTGHIDARAQTQVAAGLRGVRNRLTQS